MIFLIITNTIIKINWIYISFFFFCFYSKRKRIKEVYKYFFKYIYKVLNYAVKQK